MIVISTVNINSYPAEGMYIFFLNRSSRKLKTNSEMNNMAEDLLLIQVLKGYSETLIKNR